MLVVRVDWLSLVSASDRPRVADVVQTLRSLTTDVIAGVFRDAEAQAPHLLHTPGGTELYQQLAAIYCDYALADDTTLGASERDDVLLTLLRCRVYEVQLVALNKLLQSSASDDDADDGDDDSGDDTTCYARVCQSAALCTAVLRISISDDVNRECLAASLQVLGHMTTVLCDLIIRNKCDATILTLLPSLVRHPLQSVSCAALTLYGGLIAEIHARALACVTLIDDVMKSELVDVLEEMSLSQCSVDARLACARFLELTVHAMLLVDATSGSSSK